MQFLAYNSCHWFCASIFLFLFWKIFLKIDRTQNVIYGHLSWMLIQHNEKYTISWQISVTFSRVRCKFTQIFFFRHNHGSWFGWYNASSSSLHFNLTAFLPSKYLKIVNFRSQSLALLYLNIVLFFRSFARSVQFHTCYTTIHFTFAHSTQQWAWIWNIAEMVCSRIAYTISKTSGFCDICIR